MRDFYFLVHSIWIVLLILAFLGVISARRDQLDKLEGEFSAAREALTEALQEILDDWQAEFDERSEKWQEGEAGQEAQDRINTLEAVIDGIGESVPLPLDDLR